MFFSLSKITFPPLISPICFTNGIYSMLRAAEGTFSH